MSVHDDDVARNAEYWEALAPYRLGEPLEYFQGGGLALTETQLAAAGDVRGRRCYSSLAQ